VRESRGGAARDVDQIRTLAGKVAGGE